MLEVNDNNENEQEEMTAEEMVVEYLRLEAEFRKFKEASNNLNDHVNLMVENIGAGCHWQDPETGAVFIIKDMVDELTDKGNTIYRNHTISRYSVVHTRRKELGEKQGFALKDARALGYTVD